MTTKGILVFARNNSQIDYVMQAYHLAKRASKHLNLPTTIVTDSSEYLKSKYSDWNTVFDRVISIVWDEKDLKEDTTFPKTEEHSLKRYYDGTLSQKRLEFKNETRTLSYELTPYDETIVLDTDFLIANNILLNCFKQQNDFLLYKDAYDLSGFRVSPEFKRISDVGIDFYWATAVFFRKTPVNKVFFNLLQHVQENYSHYISIFQMTHYVYRNDHAFSIAVHIMNGYQKGNFAAPMPGMLYFTLDKDIILEIKDDEFLFLVEKEKFAGQYTMVRTKDINVHAMNKFSLNRIFSE